MAAFHWPSATPIRG